MPIEIPYTFVAGTKAKASEVNANFEAIASFVDALENNSAEIESMIETLQTSKADVNGSTSNLFRMKDAVSDYDGVNLRTLKRLTANSKGAVYGLRVTKQSNISVNATAGACWDSTYTDVIESPTSLVAEQSNLSANATYYVYITSDKESGECQLVISLSNATPTLPTGYEYYRRLAKMTTNGSGHIDTITNDNEPDLESRAGFIGSQLSWQSSPAQQNMWIYAKTSANNSWVNVVVNGLPAGNGGNAGKWGSTMSCLVPVKKGQTFSVTGSGHEARFYSMV